MMANRQPDPREEWEWMGGELSAAIRDGFESEAREFVDEVKQAAKKLCASRVMIWHTRVKDPEEFRFDSVSVDAGPIGTVSIFLESSSGCPNVGSLILQPEMARELIQKLAEALPEYGN